MIEGYWLEFHPDDYVIEVTNGNVTGCVLGFTASEMPYFLLGDVFLRGYYSVHDHTNDRIGFAPHATSKKKIIQEGVNPSNTYNGTHFREAWDYKLMSWMSIGTGWAILPLVCLICGCGTFCFTLSLCIWRCYELGNNVEDTTSAAQEAMKKSLENIKNYGKKQNQSENIFMQELSEPIRNVSLT